MPEPFEDLLAKWVEVRVVPFSMAEAATDGLGLSADKLTPSVVTRVGHALKNLGCVRRENRLAADPGERRMYLSPQLQRAEAEQRKAALHRRADSGIEAGTVSASGGVARDYF
jgi:hypothetical protein